METVLIIVVVIAALIGMAKVAGGERYSKMTEEEFEAEAKRPSGIGGAILEAQRMIDPGHRVEYIQQREKHAGAESAESGDQPETGQGDSTESGDN
jgi:hypothetical protein